MYPETLFKDTTDAYFYERDFFVAEQLAHAYLHRDYRIGMHSHEFFEINIIMSGSGRHYIGAASLDTRKGDVFVIPPETEHGYFPHPSLDIFHILIRSDFFSRYAGELHKTGGFSLLFNIEPHLRIQSGKAFHLQLDARGLEALADDLKALKTAELREEYTCANILTLALICKFSLSLQEKLYRDGESSSPDSEILRLMDHIKNNHAKKITLREVAALGNISTATLNRRFREAIDMTPMEYLIKCRTAAARELLRQNTYSKAEIAQMCGFYDTAHMNKCLAGHL